MGSYHQMGHDSQNLLKEDNLCEYSGAILSPVNCNYTKMLSIIQDSQRDNFEFVFDPQLYFPGSERGELPNWAYFPSDVDTADQCSFQWWKQLVVSLTNAVSGLPLRAICSPAIVPRSFSVDYYRLNTQIGMALRDSLAESNVETILSVLVRIDDLAGPDRIPEIASIITQVDIARVFLVLISDVEPRREFTETEGLKGCMRLISYLERAGIRVLMGFTSSDVILWKSAGVSDCATGKFFNLRRFSQSRWDEPTAGGGQLPYWFEESLMAFLRESDLIRIKDNYLSDSSKSNPYCTEILAQQAFNPGQPWLALSWRQYMYWFAEFERHFRKDEIDANGILRKSEHLWLQLDDNNILMEEPRNDGSWLRSWRRAILEYHQSMDA
jgi:hypothetical protein